MVSLSASFVVDNGERSTLKHYETARHFWSPPSDVTEMFSCYDDDTLRSLVDKHAPFADVKLHAHPNAPWYDSRCQVEKAKTRRLERAYRKVKNEESFRACSGVVREGQRGRNAPGGTCPKGSIFVFKKIF